MCISTMTRRCMPRLMRCHLLPGWASSGRRQGKQHPSKSLRTAEEPAPPRVTRRCDDQPKPASDGRASCEAKARGVRTAMGGRQARELCPDAVFVPPRMDAYSAASRDVFEVFRDTTPFVEGISIDEAFLEVGGLRRIAGTPEQIAVRLRERVRAEVGLAISVGIARTKFLAKVASAVSKPDGLLVVEPDR